ncbi:MAG: hypothetical protein ACRDUV_14600 [Pseudonocardiaceae bacterium]
MDGAGQFGDAAAFPNSVATLTPTHAHDGPPEAQVGERAHLLVQAVGGLGEQLG